MVLAQTGSSPSPRLLSGYPATFSSTMPTPTSFRSFGTGGRLPTQALALAAGCALAALAVVGAGASFLAAPMSPILPDAACLALRFRNRLRDFFCRGGHVAGATRETRRGLV